MQKSLEQYDTIDISKTNRCLDLKLASHIEGFMSAIQEQEIDTKDTRRTREEDQHRKREMEILCRVCGKHEESVYHLVCSCPVLSPTFYLDAKHNQIARILYQEVLGNEQLIYTPPQITKAGDIEIWWDEQIHTIPKIEEKQT